jgi:RimJ/RimL family protein N-acetyltransferase
VGDRGRSRRPTYVGGEIDRPTLADALERLAGTLPELFIGLRGPEDPVRRLLPPAKGQWSRAIDFRDRVRPSDEADLLAPPDGVEVVAMDAALFARTAWYADTLRAFGSIERWLELGLGRAVLEGGVLVADATAGPRTRDHYEVGVRTEPAHRGRGLGTLAAGHLLRAIEARGCVPWWNTSLDNPASMALARRLGFQRERVYDLVWYPAGTFN